MHTLFRLLPPLAFLLLFYLLRRFVLLFLDYPPRSWRWVKPHLDLAALFVCINGAWLGTEAAFTNVPWLRTHLSGRWSAPLLSRFDPARPWTSVGGVLLTEVIPWIVLAAMLAANDYRQVRLAVPGWILLRGGYYLLARYFDLPSTTEAGFADFHAAVLHRMVLFGSPVSPSRLGAAGGAFALLAVCAALLHAGAALRRRTEREDDPLIYFVADPADRRFVLGRVLGFGLAFQALAAGAAFWAARLNPLSIQAWLVEAPLFFVASLVLTRIYLAVADRNFNAGARDPRDLALGLLWSLLLVSATALALQYLGLWRWHGLQPSGGRRLAAFLFTLLFQVAATELVWRGYVLQRLSSAWGTSGFGFLVAALAASLSPCLLQPGMRGLALADRMEYLLIGLLSCFLIRFSRAIWLPIGFRCGWYAFRGLIFGLPPASVVWPLAGVSSAGPTGASVTALGTQATWIGLAALAVALWMLRCFKLDGQQLAGETR